MTSETPQQGLSPLAFWSALVLLLLPVGIPIYFAIVLDVGTWLFVGGAAALAAINLTLLFALNRWVKSLHE